VALHCTTKTKYGGTGREREREWEPLQLHSFCWYVAEESIQWVGEGDTKN